MYIDVLTYGCMLLCTYIHMYMYMHTYIFALSASVLLLPIRHFCHSSFSAVHLPGWQTEGEKIIVSYIHTYIYPYVLCMLGSYACILIFSPKLFLFSSRFLYLRTYIPPTTTGLPPHTYTHTYTHAYTHAYIHTYVSESIRSIRAGGGGPTS